MKNKTTILLLFLSVVVFTSFSMSRQITDYYTQDDPILLHIIQQVKPLFTDTQYDGLLSVVNQTNLIDTIKFYKGDKSFTINKQDVFICLTDEDNVYYNNNMLIYVLLHELSHVICDEIGHTPKFHKIFDELLIKAIDKDIYDPNIPMTENYCGY